MTRTATEWDHYYRSDPPLSRFTRPVIHGSFLRVLRRFSAPNPSIVELGGAGSKVFDAVQRELKPSVHHIVDMNQYGLSLMNGKTENGTVFLHLADVLNLNLGVQVDTCFSLGLIEHFDVERTRTAILAHLDVLRPGGIAVITFPTPTPLYQLSRGIAELAGQWIFPDERPLRMPEVEAAITGAGRLLHSELVWRMPLTQQIVVIQKPAIQKP